MSDNTLAALGFTVVGVLYIGLGIPLLLGRVAPNGIYGSRTRRTMSNEKLWYAVNRVTGRDLIIGGIAVVLAAVCIYIFRQGIDPNYATAILVTVLVTSVLLMVGDSLRAERTM